MAIDRSTEPKHDTVSHNEYDGDDDGNNGADDRDGDDENDNDDSLGDDGDYLIAAVTILIMMVNMLNYGRLLIIS